MTDTFICDRLPLTGLQRDSAGNVIGVARAARTGIQVYAGYELGRPELRQVRVYRPEEEVFAVDSMRTFAGAPLTIEHPRGLVTPETWKDVAVGETASDDIVRDGDVVKVPFILRDAGGIKAIEDGKHEVSMGYTAMLDFTAGQTPGGEAYDAVQRNIRINHLAIVDKARGGPTLRIGDTAPEKTKVETRTIMVDGLSVTTTDAGAQAIEKLTRERDEARQSVADANTKLGEQVAAVSTKDGEIVTLKAQLADAQSPDKLNAAAQARATLMADAKRVNPKIEIGSKSDAEIRKEVVAAKLGDAAAALDDNGITGAFAALVAAAPKGNTTPGGNGHRADPLAQAIVGDGNGNAGESIDDQRKALADARAARAHRYENFGAERKTA